MFCTFPEHIEQTQTSPPTDADAESLNLAATNLDDINLCRAVAFVRHVGEVKPALHTLADALVADYPNRNWNIVFSEDTGGRLPTRFIRKVLKGHGIEIPTVFVGASRAQRNVTPHDQYVRLVRQKADETGNDRALVLTENIGLGLGAKFMHDTVASAYNSVDLASVVSRDGHHEGIAETVYLGAEGNAAANNAVLAFEEIQRATHHWTNTPLTGILADTSGNSPHSYAPRRHPQDLITFAYRHMDLLADEYTQLYEHQQ